MCLIHILQRNIDMVNVFTYDTDGADENFLQPAIYDSLTVLVKKSVLPESKLVNGSELFCGFFQPNLF
ncbi:hypothetical protein D917_01275 [Trichinella nativa]|uniref:Uncharacterized protein n=1 Tax=Trichinella nativa TaxID=6335 RepID=A0A1Y3ETI2_9BILA|nr:hypothetical protein D917_01275 [Trichinella nativa]